MKYAACAIREVRARRWWPAYEIGQYNRRWQAVFMCWWHFYTSDYIGETWIELRPEL